MGADNSELQIITSEDGVMIFGSEQQLAKFDDKVEMPARKLDAKALQKVSTLVELGGKLQQQSGRWMKLSEDSAQSLKKMGVRPENLNAGVVRVKDIPNIAKGGQIAKHLKFEQAGLLTPAAPMVVASMLQQQALENSLEEIQEYLEQIDKKLDQLIKQRKVEVLGQLGGIQASIREALLVHDEVGLMSDVSWSKVQSNSTQLQVMLSEAVEQLKALAERAAEASGDPDKAAKELPSIQSDVSFWLHAIAAVLQTQDRQYLLELYRVEATNIDHLESHRRGIAVARDHRTRELATSLNALVAEIQRAVDMTTFKRVTNVINAPKAVTHANAVNKEVSRFASAAEVPLSKATEIALDKWDNAFKSLLGDARDGVRDRGVSVKNKVGDTAQSLNEKRREIKLPKPKKPNFRRKKSDPSEA